MHDEHNEKMIFSILDLGELSTIFNTTFLHYFLSLLYSGLVEAHAQSDKDKVQIQERIFKNIDLMAEKLYKDKKNREHDISRAKLLTAKAMVRIMS